MRHRPESARVRSGPVAIDQHGARERGVKARRDLAILVREGGRRGHCDRVVRVVVRGREQARLEVEAGGGRRERHRRGGVGAAARVGAGGCERAREGVEETVDRRCRASPRADGGGDVQREPDKEKKPRSPSERGSTGGKVAWVGVKG